jgi:hypothetical protein
LISNLAEGASMKREAETFFFQLFCFDSQILFLWFFFFSHTWQKAQARHAKRKFFFSFFSYYLAEGAGTTREARNFFRLAIPVNLRRGN